MKYILSVVAVAVIFISCQKEVDWGKAANNGDYQPVTAGSTWNYTSTSAGNYTVNSLGTDTTINGKRYYKFDNVSSGGTARSYIAKLNGVYWQYGDFAPAGQVLELIYLKDSAIGTNWTNRMSVGGFNNYHKYTITAKNTQRTVNSVVFNNVIELNYEFSLDNPLGGGVLNVGGGKQYYAKNVGAIESFFSVGFLGFNVTDTTRLVSYTIR